MTPATHSTPMTHFGLPTEDTRTGHQAVGPAHR